MSQTQKKEARNLGLFDIFSLGFGGAVGSGIFVLIGLGIQNTGKSIVLSVVVGCIVMLLAYFYNVLLSSMFMFEGGDYSQKAIAFNPFFTGLSGYINFINGFSIAMYAVAIVNYASIIFPQLGLYSKPVAIVIITLLFAATIKGSKFISSLNSIMTVVLISSILLFIVMGLPKVQVGYFNDTQFFLNGRGGFISAIAIMGWACQGTTMGPVSVTAVTKNSKRNIPLGILLVTIALAIVYGLMSYVASGVLPIQEVAGKNLSAVASEIFPRTVFVIFILGGAVSAIATSMITGITMVRYPLLKVAQDGWLPNVFKKTTGENYPWVIYLVIYIISVIPILTGTSLDAMVSLVMIPNMIMNIYVNIKCISIIKKYPEQWKQSVLHMPNIFMFIILVLSALCAGIVCYNLFIGLKPMEMATLIAIMIVMSLLSIFSLKTNRVDEEKIYENKEKILKEAMEFVED